MSHEQEARIALRAALEGAAATCERLAALRDRAARLEPGTADDDARTVLRAAAAHAVAAGALAGLLRRLFAPEAVSVEAELTDSAGESST
ncbi:MAG TPA: hypothetical protein VNI83_03615 [Vicinamibacterales bacterium]|nr:hypothetical protein [Vicinamibacterales bacterium]